MKIKLTDAGWANLTGFFGAVEFIDGVSVNDVSHAEAARMASLVQLECVDTGSNPSPAQQILDTWASPMALATTPTEPENAVAGTPTAGAKVWTHDELAAIADTKGIKGLREIAEPLGLRDNKTADLIVKILAANPVAPAEPAETTEPAAGNSAE